MAQQQTFRSALNGFNREDVVRYLEYLNTKHAAEISQLNSELEYLRSELAAKESAPAAASPETDALIEEQAARIRELFDRCKELETELKEAKAEKPAETQQTVSTDAELAAYRRAERTERLARERAEQVYHQVNGTLADATVKVENAAAQIGDLTDRVMGQLTALQNAVSGSRQALSDAAASLYAIRPETEE